MKINFAKLILLLIFFCSIHLIPQAQELTVKGKVTDTQTGDAIPFANVYPKKNPSAGTTTDFDGYFTLKISDVSDSLVVSYIGYVKKIKALDRTKLENGVLVLNFQLVSEEKSLDEIVVKAGEDPAYPIMRQVLKNKDLNDKRKIEIYECEVYTKIEIDIDNISDKFGQRKIIKKVQNAIDSSGGGLTGEDGKPLIPLFLSEAISRHYVRNNPDRTREDVLKTKVNGVGFDDNTAISQILGSSFQEYNFYRNWINLLEKDFVSPLADGWKFHYDYYLEDSVKIGNHFCYRIEVVPKRPADLAFEGLIWIDKQTYALKQIDVTIYKKANINFMEKIKVQQEYEPSALGPWLPSKTRVMVDVAQITPKSAGFLARFYTSNKDYLFGKKYPIKFYDEKLTVAQDANFAQADYWATARHDSLTPAELKTYALIDTIKQVPVVKAYSEIINILGSGDIQVGKLSIGNLAYTYGNNNVEGHRLRFGIRTNSEMSRFFEVKTYVAYGTEDRRWKYSAGVRFIPHRKSWTQFGYTRSEDIIQVAVNPNGVNVPGAFLASLTFGNLANRSPFWKAENNFFVQSDLFKGYTQSVRLVQASFTQIGNHFAYFENPEMPDSPTQRDFNTTELIFETRLAKDERFFYNGNYRYSLGTKKFPVITVRYTLGLKGFWNGDFNYHRFAVNFEQGFRFGALGRTYYSLTASYTPSTVPYPMLEIHLGNRGNFYNFYGFNLMNFLEFVSDQHVALNFEHNFDGLITNRIPLLKKLKLRTFIAANVLMGHLNARNQAIIPNFDSFGNPLRRPNSLETKPYTELGYGLDNIFRFFRVTFLHRMTYRDAPGVRRFGVFFSARFNL
ncbi:MAG: DUF5686 and carboxypeptidase regulatory-like domain-containing protein [Microscillaceae bacterium]|jgi:hypothetical protein|nr:DUF5686 and carboxypeptidase regulatory-like domain-containing protein [Microscillaceae bacterium]